MNNDISNKSSLSLGLDQYSKNEVRETIRTKTQEVTENTISKDETNTRDISLTPTVALLKELTEQINKLPIVDNEKVASAKAKLASNTFEFKNKSTQEAASLRIAEKLLQLDRGFNE